MYERRILYFTNYTRRRASSGGCVNYILLKTVTRLRTYKNTPRALYRCYIFIKFTNSLRYHHHICIYFTAKAAKSAGALRSRPEPGHVMRSVDRAVKRGFAHRVSRRGVDGMPLTNNNSDIFVDQNYTGGNKTNFTNY